MDTCPLNVCCSKDGYCGTTKDFCGDKKVERPSCKGSKSSFSNIVGYYEGWSAGRPCNRIFPEDIPQGVYSQLNFAFATIDPQTFEIRPSHPRDLNLYSRMAKLKEQDPFLKVYIAIGGWAFNDPGPTRNVFSDLAASENNQRKFFASLVSFLTTYDFDGVDIDWEYPGADDRGGKPEDLKNFPVFLSNLKQVLRGTGGRDGVSITLPASYWYLKHFDIKNIVKHVDVFNIMSYDMHGLWDKDIQWTGPFLNAHTNMTEITEALDLLWRNDIKPSQVVFGLGFYGRVFTVKNNNCNTPNCLFTDAGAPGKCSGEAGILLNSEIQQIMMEKGLTPKAYDEEMVKTLTWGNQWIAFDDAKTIKMKVDFVRSMCLSGVMVWAVSHDTENGRFGKALSQAAGKSLGMSRKMASGSITINEKQCRWTNCGQTCPVGWIPVERSDPGARKGELLLDGQWCNKGEGVHTFRCPGDQELPKCGWFNHKNGKCAPGCPPGMYEIGSNDQYCNNGNWQTACCSVAPSLSVYNTCSWNQQNGDCKNPDRCSADRPTEMQSGLAGSGASHCLSQTPRNWKAYKLCCDDKDENHRLEDCRWYDNIGTPTKSGRGGHKQCLSGCPDDRVRVGMDGYGGSPSCYNNPRGGRARCCIAKKLKKIDQETGRLDQFRDALNTFVKNPVCRNPGRVGDIFESMPTQTVLWGFGRVIDNSTIPTDLVLSQVTARSISESLFAPDSPDRLAETLCLEILTGRNPVELIEQEKRAIWNNSMGEHFNYLKTDYLEPYVKGSPRWQKDGPIQMCHDVMCHMQIYNGKIADKLGSKPSSSLHCPACPLNSDSEDCKDDEDNLTPEKRKRSIYQTLSSFTSKILPRSVAKILAPQTGSSRKYTVSWTRSDGSIRSAIIRSRTYPTGDDFPPGHPIFQRGYLDAFINNCDEFEIIAVTVARNAITGWEAEHVVELNTIPDFFNDYASGVLPSGARTNVGRANAAFFEEALFSDYLLNPVPMTGGFNSRIPFERVFNSLGSEVNSNRFTWLGGHLNKLKSRVWRLGPKAKPWGTARMKGLIRNSPGTAFARMKDVFLVFDYFNKDDIHADFVAICNDIREQLRQIQNEFNGRHPPAQHIDLVAFWDLWIRDKLRKVTSDTQAWLHDWLKQFDDIYEPDAVNGGAAGEEITERIADYKIHTNALHIETQGLH